MPEPAQTETLSQPGTSEDVLDKLGKLLSLMKTPNNLWNLLKMPDQGRLLS